MQIPPQLPSRVDRNICISQKLSRYRSFQLLINSLLAKYSSLVWPEEKEQVACATLGRYPLFAFGIPHARFDFRTALIPLDL